MSTKKLFDEIIKTAEKKREKIISEAKKIAIRLEEEEIKRINTEKEKILKRAEAEIIAEKEKLLALLEIKLYRKKLLAQEKVINDIFNEAGKKVKEKDTLETIVQQVKRLEKVFLKKNLKNIKIYLSQNAFKQYKDKIKKEAEDILKARITIEEAEKPIIGGIIVSDMDGKFLCDYSFDIVLKNLKEKMRYEIARELNFVN